MARIEDGFLNTLQINPIFKKGYHGNENILQLNIIWYHFFVEPKIGYKWTYLRNRPRLIDVENNFMITVEERWGEGSISSLGLTDTPYYYV